MKKFLITGATNGIGKETAIKVIKNNYHLIIVARNIKLIEETIKELKTINKEALITFYVVDFTNLNQVNEVANLIKKDHPIIDNLFLNAGAVSSKIGETIEHDINKAMAINYLGPRLFLDILIDNVKNSLDKMIFQTVSMSSPNQYNHEELVNINKLTRIKSYGLSKLFMEIYLYKLTLTHKEIKFRLIDPVIIYTNATKNMIPKPIRFVAPLMKIFARKPSKIADEIFSILNNCDKYPIQKYKKLKIQNPNQLCLDKTMYRIINDYYKKQLGHYRQTIIFPSKKADK